MSRIEEKEINDIRRKDRGKDEEWIKQYLKFSSFAAISTLHGDQPFINHNIYFYDEIENCIYFHTAKEGRLRYNVDLNTKICLSIAEMGRLLPADVALEFSVEYRSVVVFGLVEIIEEEDKAKMALQKLMDKYFPHLKSGKDYREIISEELKRTSVYKIIIERMSGKEKKVDENFSGAFLYPYREKT